MIGQQCISCKHFDLLMGNCPAFPGGIPDEIFSDEISHREPYPGDHDIQFEAAQ